MKDANLFLLPNSLDQNCFHLDYFPADLSKIIASLDGIFVENEKNARKYLLQFMDREKMQQITMRVLNEHTKDHEIEEFISLIQNKQNFGVLSDAGMPCIADPGAKLVNQAKKHSIKVISIVGPSSIMMSLMLSGLSAQKFTFHGYLPRKTELLTCELEQIEKNAKEKSFTHLWIEAPYRSDKMLQECLKTLSHDTYLCVAINLSTKEEKVLTYPIKVWKQKKIEIGKNPCVFLISTNNA
jgi:16S rRNA (cytidine1402-2'-O)-methyltransferase